MHAARHGWDLEKDAPLFMRWAIHTGKTQILHRALAASAFQRFFVFMTLPDTTAVLKSKETFDFVAHF